MPNPPPPKSKIREQIDADVQTFLHKGGKIDQIAQGKSGAKPKRYGAGNFILNPEKGKDPS